MRVRLLILLMLGLLGLANAAEHHVILCGGPALRKWENLRVERDQHDRWWANFIRASTLRMVEIRRAYGKEAKITWIVYRPGYVARGAEDGKPYTKWITEQATKRNVTLRWVSSGSAAISAINNHPSKSVVTFDFFGHSNKFCFLLDYSSYIMGVSKAWIHQNELGKIRSSIFARHAQCQSWGCHTGESMSAVWKRQTGKTLIGVRGKTNYEAVGQGRMPTVNGSWVR
ncbi:hypothetical protein HW115_00415 [Verrucomicrobiaceae bacterium N1E253]|uniref:Uncharacterized protein n=1 Tax=Oceaniferula marina TaxID=2748318 RepID=A0A851GFW3_9BACT|nr:hypothetical protein [Oceaniferula marina]NWK54057.1 hypothetical protein [Oceaniferula marina]